MKVLTIVKNQNLRITDNLVAYIHIKKEFVFVGYEKETNKKFIITDKFGNKLELLKGDDNDYRDESYYMYNVKDIIENSADTFLDQ